MKRTSTSSGRAYKDDMMGMAAQVHDKTKERLQQMHNEIEEEKRMASDHHFQETDWENYLLERTEFPKFETFDVLNIHKAAE